jgi:putative ABC transport system permease protein
MLTAIHLSLKEIRRNLGRFILFSLVVALITILVLFIAALGRGLLGGIREYYVGLNADLIVYQDTARRVAASSRLECATQSTIRRIEGVRDVGPIGFSSGSVVDDDGAELLDISLIGVEPGKPGEPSVLSGQGLTRKNADEVIVDRNVAEVAKLEPGDWLTIRTIQGIEAEYHTLQVIGVSDSLRFNLAPSVFVPIVTWDKIKPQGSLSGSQSLGSDTTGQDPACNVAAVQLDDPTQIERMQRLIQAQVSDVEAVDRTTAYQSLPGYSSIQSSLATQNTFALLISTLVIGGFFQIQTLQKVPQLGMLKAIGTPNIVVALAAMLQIMVVTLMGIAVASVIIAGIASVFPADVPIVFDLRSGVTAVASIFVLGFLGGLISVRYALRVEPLIALGLGT